MSKSIIITQSNYIPWKGYFDQIAKTDEFVIYDDMQYTRRDWRNRNLIKTPSGLKWLTIPVSIKGKYLQKINETEISDAAWPQQHLNLLKQNYKTATGYKEIISVIEDLYQGCTFKLLTEINEYFIKSISSILGINVNNHRSEKFILAEDRTERLVNICLDLKATDYYSGPAAQAYMDESKFKENSVNVHYFDYSGYIEYPQLFGKFEHHVSIIDLLFNVGWGAKKYLKYTNEAINNQPGLSN